MAASEGVTTDRVSFHPAALEEADAAAAWYAERSESTPERFLEEVDWAIERIASNPQAYARFEGDSRRILLPHFPYQIIFSTPLKRCGDIGCGPHSKAPELLA